MLMTYFFTHPVTFNLSKQYLLCNYLSQNKFKNYIKKEKNTLESSLIEYSSLTVSADNLIECVKKKDHQKVRASFEYIKHINTTTSLFHFLGFSYFGVDFWHRVFF